MHSITVLLFCTVDLTIYMYMYIYIYIYYICNYVCVQEEYTDLLGYVCKHAIQVSECICCA